MYKIPADPRRGERESGTAEPKAIAIMPAILTYRRGRSFSAPDPIPDLDAGTESPYALYKTYLGGQRTNLRKFGFSFPMPPNKPPYIPACGRHRT